MEQAFEGLAQEQRVVTKAIHELHLTSNKKRKMSYEKRKES